ncbi:MAG: ABC transporter permease [Anaerolineae bacterium]|uniref:ABC transporter permease n=1 Tax=Promineifilum sp. TaxID=2664178 RepID=UPI001D9B9D4C|nr:ABC transporter permease [Anaerolineales bacterium]MCB8936139.1 ABC transporter permease [Promineifilum sp.]MCO5182021.1 ABC transporter permease [Promineifilum sp.]MCW5846146.1 ABC transporter permease [Anaerolineae bacterium]
MTSVPAQDKGKDRAIGAVRRIWRSISVPLVAVLLGLLIGGILLFVSGANPFEAYGALIKGAFGTPVAVQRTLEKATPLVFSGLAVAFAFKAGLFNIGAQGQLLIGAIVAAYVGFAIEGLPAIIHAPLALLIGGLAGALYGYIPGVLKVYTGAHEVIVTIMLNYVAINITDYLADGPWKDLSPGNVVARTPKIQPSAEIPILGNIPLGFIFAVLAAIIVWWLLYRTTLGYEIRTVGLNASAAQYAGIRVARMVILTMMISGFLAGFGGAVETLGIVGRYQPGFNAGLGFDGITVALLGKTSPFGVIPAALLMGAMRAGASQMQFSAGVAKEITDVITAFILFFVAADVIVKWLIRQRDSDDERIMLSSGWGGN